MYPLRLTESTLQALQRESQALATLPYEATCAVILDPAGEVLDVMRHTEGQENVTSINLPDLICEIYERNGAEPGGGCVIMHSHPVNGACEPSSGDRTAIEILREGLEKAGLVLQDFVICGRPGAHGWSWRESVAVEAGEVLTESARPPQTDWDRRYREQERLWRHRGGVPWR